MPIWRSDGTAGGAAGGVVGGVVDVVVVGAGPAGLAAAARASGAGATVTLIDAGATPGGQYWRHPPSTGTATDEQANLGHLHHDLRTYRRLALEVRAHQSGGRLAYLPEHQVWAVAHDPGGFRTHLVDRRTPTGATSEVVSRTLVLATGAYDRQVPFPGWDLPGVMTAGGVQALLKGHGVLAGNRIVVAGTGPFLLPVAAGLAGSGATVVGIHEASTPTRWLPEWPAVVRAAAKLGEGAGYAATLARHRVPLHARSVVVAAHGDRALEAVTVARLDRTGQVADGSERTVAADTLAVGWGFTPQIELPMALGCATRVDIDGSVVCTVDDEQQSSVGGVFIAGEACGVGGAALAVVEGDIAGRAAAATAGHAPDPRPGIRARTRTGGRDATRRRSALRAFADAMHRAHPVPSAWIDRITPDTLVCRCEEVTAGRLREAVTELGAGDPRTAKLLARPGMGWCQGRVCGYATACLSAAWSGEAYSPADAATRPVAGPVTLGSLAAPDRSAT